METVAVETATVETVATTAATVETVAAVPAEKPSEKAVKKAAKPSLPPPPAKKLTAEERRIEASRELAKAVAIAGLDKKAERIEIIDVCGKVDYADFIVLMSGRSDRQVQAIANGIEGALRERGVRALNAEGMRQGVWVVVDFGDVFVHVFLEEERQHRDLESLWMDARRVPIELPNAPAQG